MLKKLIILSTCITLASCTIRYVDHATSNTPSKQARVTTPAVPHVMPKPSPSKAIRFGNAPSIAELARQQNIPQGGGIKQGYVVLVPSQAEWNILHRRALNGRPTLHIKTIKRGDTIAKASRYKTEGLTALAPHSIPTIALSERVRSDQCKIIIDTVGEPLTIRPNETGINRYAFYHTINHVKFNHQSRQGQLNVIESQLSKETKKQERLKSSLAINPAHQNNQCVMVAQKPIPPAPKRIDPKIIERNAHGHCVNLLGSRFSQEQVIDALESAGRWDVSSNYQKWAFGEKMSCAVGVNISEFESLKTRAIGWIAPNLGKDYFRDAMRKDVNHCVAKVKYRCDDGYDAWERQKNRIVNEPRKLKNECRATKQALANYDNTRYIELKQQLEQALTRVNAAKIKQQTFSRNTLLPFTDKRTYCQ